MPSLTSRSPDLALEGPIIEVNFIISAELEEKFIAESKQVPEPVPVKALIDTGASHSVIRADIPEKLRLTPVGSIKINTPSTENHECYQYFMRILFPSHNLIYNGVFTAAPLKGQNISCLIGRDILKDGLLIYIGQDNSFTFSIL